MINHTYITQLHCVNKKCVAGAAAYLLLALLLHLSNASRVLHVAVLLHSLGRLLQLPAVVLQLLYVVLLLYNGALMLMLLSLQMAHILLEPLYLKEHCASQALQQSCFGAHRALIASVLW